MDTKPRVIGGWGEQGRHRPIAKLIIGLVAILAGILFLLDHQGIIDMRSFWRAWPVIFILFGIAKLFEQNARDKIVGTGLMFLIGIALLLINFGYFQWTLVWPVGLIVIGVLLIWQSLRAKHAKDRWSGALDSYAVFSSVEKNFNERDFNGGQVDAVFGSVEIDLTHADMQGETANIDLHVVFGSIEMRVPESWKVDIQAGAVFGSCENKTRTPLLGTNPKVLAVRGDVVFGSVEIRN